MGNALERHRRLLQGKTIFLSASVPSLERSKEFRRIDEAPLRIEDAVISLCRAIFNASGSLVFGGHPAVSPLVAMVAGEYLRPISTETREERTPRPIQIYQSKAFKGHEAKDTDLLERQRYAQVYWIEQHESEHGRGAQRLDPLELPKSLQVMRTVMIEESNPVCMVCIGGMEGVLEEHHLFTQLRPGRPIFVMSTTGGASAILAEKDDPQVDVLDRAVMLTLKERTPKRAKDESKMHGLGENDVPYPLVMQYLVEKIGSMD
ncbi:MAG: SLOG domain-containing protein [Acidiferrobacteraceae bacterium]